ncbi:unnamed protein product [Fraxinus pennsylvanica]|uniref:Uncharacterized protein n=1 Tax=Fraxinus pennsylvanica TaxID=56036 RepID=A0AAD1ZM37_9LAMI|nr:unnamed protein product [Fraxinus pennsylvanica]
MDLGDAVSYVKRLNIPSGVVGACRLDIAYEHFKEKPDLFQFIPNEKQVKEADKLLKTMFLGDGRKKVNGVPVFSAQNLDIAIVTEDAIKWYTPYFFDKNVLDNILEESVDQHFHVLTQTRHLQRRQDILGDNLSDEAVEEMAETLLEPSEVQEMMDEIGNPDGYGQPLEFNPNSLTWSIHLKKKIAASFLRANMSSSFIADSGFRDDVNQSRGISEVERKDNFCDKQGWMLDFRFPLGGLVRSSLVKTTAKKGQFYQ